MKSFSILCLLFSFSGFSQSGHTDLKEYGLNGRVKKIVTYVYDSARWENNEWVPEEKAFSAKIIYFYNEKGFIDSTHYLVRIKEAGHDMRLRTLYQFNNDKRAGHREYENDVLKETATITWIDDFTYLTRVKYPDTGDATELMNSLSANYRDHRGEIRVFSEDGKISYCSSYENKLDGNKITSAVTTNCLANEQTITDYLYQQYDGQNNPVSIITLNSSSKKPEKIWVRQIEYY